MSDDTISREAAKKIIREKIQAGKEGGCLRYRSMKNFIDGLDYAIDLLDCVPSEETKSEQRGQ